MLPFTPESSWTQRAAFSWCMNISPEILRCKGFTAVSDAKISNAWEKKFASLVVFQCDIEKPISVWSSHSQHKKRSPWGIAQSHSEFDGLQRKKDPSTESFFANAAGWGFCVSCALFMDFVSHNNNYGVTMYSLISCSKLQWGYFAFSKQETAVSLTYTK